MKMKRTHLENSGMLDRYKSFGNLVYIYLMNYYWWSNLS